MGSVKVPSGNLKLGFATGCAPRWLHRATFEGVLRSLVVKETTATGARARLRGQRRWRLRVDANASPQLLSPARPNRSRLDRKVRS